jgi:hypothetical protein
MIQHPNMLETPAAGNQSVHNPQEMPNTMKDPAERRCFNYGEKCHYAQVYHKLHLQPNQMPATNPSPNRGANSVSVTATQNLARGRVNQMAMVEAQDTTMNGTILINLYSVLTIPWPLFFSVPRILGRDSF